MLPACNRGSGMNVHAPDVCLTPPGVPKPYVDVGLNKTAVAFVPHVFVVGMNAHNMATVIPRTFGDEAGSMHWTTKGFSLYIQGNPIVAVGKLPSVHLTCRSIGNRGNAATGFCAVPSAVNVFYTHLRGEEAAPPTPRSMLDDLPASGAAAAALVDVQRDAAGGLRLGVARIGGGVPLAIRRELARCVPSSVVLDLRGNPGGDLDAAVRLVELFVPAGTVVARLRDERGLERVLRTRIAPAYEGPLRVVVDEGTASAAEVVAAALEDASRAVVVGARTFGKGTIQAFADDELVTVATARRAGGGPIESVGVIPRSEGMR